ncbi:MAG: DUF4149 domain-containing protein [Betaproteobacteria bacterium]|nr:DUF4149 domain-containing protein [Betaproteobacteria bacterium]
MRAIAHALQSIAVTLWVGGLWVAGFILVPLLFARLGSPLAGALAGKVFELIAYIGIGCATYLLAYRLARAGAGSLKQAFFWIVLVMLVFTLAGEFGVQPILKSLKAEALPKKVMESVLRERFNTWHGIASGLYVIESALGLILVVLLGKGR